MRASQLHSALLTAVLATSLVAGTAASAAVRPYETQNAGLGIRLLDAPVDRRDDPRARTYIVDHVKPGTTITRRVQISDNTDKPLRAALYVEGATIEAGAFRPAERGTPSELAAWSSLTPPSVVLPARGTSDAKVTIAVPADASAGERYGVIWAELPPAESQGVRQVNRVGVRIYLSVGAGGEPSSDFTVDSLQATRRGDGVPLVLAQIHNTGGRALDMRGSLTLKDGPAGLSAGPFPATLGTSLLAGQTAPVTIALDKAISGGPWTATLEVRSGVLVRTATARLTFPDRAGTAAPPVDAEDVPAYQDESTVRLIAIGLVGLLLLLLLLLAAREWVRRRRTA